MSSTHYAASPEYEKGQPRRVRSLPPAPRPMVLPVKNPVQLLLCLPAPRTAFLFPSFLLQALFTLQVPRGSHWAKTKVSPRGPEGRIRVFAFFSFRGQPHNLVPRPIFKASGRAFKGGGALLTRITTASLFHFQGPLGLRRALLHNLPT